MALEQFFSLRAVLFDLFLDGHFFSAKNLNLFSNNFKPFFNIINGISAFGKIAANYNFCLREILLVNKRRNNFLLIFIRQLITMNYLFVYWLLFYKWILKQNRWLYLYLLGICFKKPYQSWFSTLTRTQNDQSLLLEWKQWLVPLFF
jgi:hypothetical protein